MGEFTDVLGVKWYLYALMRSGVVLMILLLIVLPDADGDGHGHGHGQGLMGGESR